MAKDEELDKTDEPGDALEPEELEVESEDAPTPEPKLYAGKFKTPEDMEVAYKEAEKRMFEAIEEAKQAREPESAPSAPPPQPNFAEEFNNRAWEDPWTAFGQLLGASNQVQRQATAGRKRSLAQFKTDPLYSEVKDEFEAELELVDDYQMANPEAAKQIVEALYDRVSGRFARQAVAQAQKGPKERVEVVRKLGVAAPEASPDTAGGFEVDRSGLDILGELGVRNKSEAAKKIAQRIMKKRQQGDEADND